MVTIAPARASLYDFSRPAPKKIAPACGIDAVAGSGFGSPVSEIFVLGMPTSSVAECVNVIYAGIAPVMLPQQVGMTLVLQNKGACK
jgi:hypothetical protein